MSDITLPLEEMVREMGYDVSGGMGLELVDGVLHISVLIQEKAVIFEPVKTAVTA